MSAYEHRQVEWEFEEECRRLGGYLPSSFYNHIELDYTKCGL
jgi:hypothetical protein